MDVLAAAEDLLEHVLAGDMSQQPQLHLRVVGRHELVAGGGDEAGADLTPERRPDRDVLQVGVVRRQPPGRRRGLVERRVQPAVGIDEQRQRVQIGLRELGQLPPALDLGDDLVLGADRLQHPGVGRVSGLAAALARQPELAEQDLLQLPRRAEHELLPRQLVDLPLQPVCLLLDPLGDLVQPLGVQPDPDLLHLTQDPDDRQLDVVEQVGQPAATDLLPLPGGQRVGQPRVGRRPDRRGRSPGRAPRRARGTGRRDGRAPAGRRRPRCRGRDCAAPRPATSRRGRSPDDRRSPPPAPRAAARSRRSPSASAST